MPLDAATSVSAPTTTLFVATPLRLVNHVAECNASPLGRLIRDEAPWLIAAFISNLYSPHGLLATCRCRASLGVPGACNTRLYHEVRPSRGVSCMGRGLA